MEFSDKIRQFIRKIFPDSKSAVMAAVAAGAVVFAAGTILISMQKTPVLELYVNGNRVGYVENADVYAGAKKKAEQELQLLSGVPYRFPESDASYRVATVFNPEFSDTEAVSGYLADSAKKFFCEGWGLYIDETLVAVGKSQTEIRKVLDETLALYSELYSAIKTSDDIISFAATADIRKMTVPETAISSYEEIRQTLGLGNLENLNELLLKDNTKSGEMTVKDIAEMLPELEEITTEEMSLGLPAENVYQSSEDTGTEKETSAVLSFQSKNYEISRVAIPFEEEIVYDDSLEQGTKVLVSSGVYGVRQSVYEVCSVDGDEVSRVLVSDNVLKKPVAEKYKVGTKKKTNTYTYKEAAPGSTEAVATGTYILPADGTITSTYSGRYLFGRYEFHGAVDIANDKGTPIYASDGGTVTYADYDGTYGHCIIIDHGNGMKTLYAHLSAYCVNVGDKVGQGWKIGEMGNSGRVTGEHVHFEVRKDGKRVDPMLYVNK